MVLCDTNTPTGVGMTERLSAQLCFHVSVVWNHWILGVLTVLLPPLPVLVDLQSHLLVTSRVELLNLQVCRWTTALTALVTHSPLHLPLSPPPPPLSDYPLSSFSFPLPRLYICLASLSHSSPLSTLSRLPTSPPSSSLPRSSSLSLLAAYLNAPLEKD